MYNNFGHMYGMVTIEKLEKYVVMFSILMEIKKLHKEHFMLLVNILHYILVENHSQQLLNLVVNSAMLY